MTEKKTDDELVVLAGAVTIKRKVGAGMAYVDVTQGEAVGEIDDETRDRLLASGAIGQRDGDRYIPAVRPVPGEVEPDEIPPGLLPGGSTEEILAWVGDDLARARVAMHEERAKGDKARRDLLDQLTAVAKDQEPEPPTVPESYDPNVVPAAPGGVATPELAPQDGAEFPDASSDAGSTSGRRSTAKRTSK